MSTVIQLVKRYNSEGKLFYHIDVNGLSSVAFMGFDYEAARIKFNEMCKLAKEGIPEDEILLTETIETPENGNKH